MPVTLSVVSFGAEATDALQKAISAAQRNDRLSPVTVVAPSNYANLSLRRQLASEGPIVNVRFLVFSRLAELLGAPLLSRNLQPLTPWIRAEAVRSALSAHLRTCAESRFAGVSAHAATGESLEGTFRDLREASEGTLEKLERSSERAREVVTVFRHYRQLVVGRYYDEADLARAAVEAVGDGSPAVRDIGHVILYLPAELSEAEARLVVALGDSCGATAILGATGERIADASLLPMQAKLSGSKSSHQPAFIPVKTAPVTHIAIVPDADEEVGTAMRAAMAMARRGVPLNRMAFLYPNARVYGPLVHERLEAAGIPHNGPAVGTLAQSISGRFLLGLLRLPSAGFRRDAVMDWLTSGPAIDPETGGAPPANAWDAISREAGVVAGSPQWVAQLRRYVVRLEQKQLDPERPLTDGQASFVQSTIAQTNRLRRFMEVLAADLERAVAPTWKAQSERARWLLDRYMGAHANFEGCPDEQRKEAERAAYEQVLEQITTIEALDSVAVGGSGGSVDARSFVQTLERLLDAPAGRVGPFGHGIFCGPVAIAAGMDFDSVFVLGMTEGQMPTVGGEDPLLPDHERAAADAMLSTRAGRRGEQRRDYLAALASAGAAGAERIVVAPVADLRGQKKQLPSRWLLEAAGTLGGRAGPLATREFGAMSSQPWLTRNSSFQAALRDAPEPGMAQEYDLRLMLGGSVGQQLLATLEPALQAGMTATAARSGRSLGRFEGVIGARPELRPSEAKPTSATALQTWAKCPFSYFLKHVLRVGEREEPEDILVLDAAERGTIIHETLAAFMRENAGWSSAWEPRHRAQIVAMGEKRCQEAQDQGITGKSLLWGVERQRIRRDLEGFLEADSERRTQLGYRFVAAEYGFGTAANGPPPVTVDLTDGSKVAFRGSIDRVDRHPDGRLSVYDYKTGGTFAYRGMDQDPLKGGTLLQLPIYALAAQRDFGEPSTGVWASYWFVTRQGEYAHNGYEVTADRRAEFRRALGVISTGMGAGQFPANPGKATGRNNGPANCTYCPYDRICPRDRQRAWERKKEAGAIVEYLALTEGATADDID